MTSTQSIERKSKKINELGKIFKNNGVYLFDYRGLTVSEMEYLRYKIKELGTQHWNQPDLKAATSIHAVFIPSNSTHGIKNIGNNRLTYLTAN